MRLKHGRAPAPARVAAPGQRFPIPAERFVVTSSNSDAAACEPCGLHANLGGLRFRFAAGLSGRSTGTLLRVKCRYMEDRRLTVALLDLELVEK